MPRKEQIVAELGDCLIPNLVNQALAANDRLKYFMTLLQTARERAECPHSSCSDLASERAACGVEDASFDRVVAGSSREGPSSYFIPEAERIRQRLHEDLQIMLAPIQAAERDSGDVTQSAADYARRADVLAASLASFPADRISAAQLDDITAARPAERDSVHLLVMNLHKELNRLQQRIAAESIDGARVYGLRSDDRRWVAAFMRGVQRTCRLKFDHPGLDTTATRTGDVLIIQNDIGTTDAHVLVIHVTADTVTVTYTDGHIQRLAFFHELLGKFTVHWEDTRSRHSAKLSEDFYHLSIGRFTSDDDCAREGYLEHLGSRLVFLIDWNRARKRLRKLAPKRVCLGVLQWAAENDLGHMAFLRMGGEQLVYDALQLSHRAPLQLGRPLSDILGEERTAEFLRFTLRTAAEGLLADRSELLIRDQVRAELRHYLDTSHQSLLELAAEHASLIVELAAAPLDCLVAPGTTSASDFLARIARRAKKWEHAADELVSKARSAFGGSPDSKAAAELVRIADDAADELEEGIFLLTLLHQSTRAGSNPLSQEAWNALHELAQKLPGAAREYLKAVENARCITRASSREEMADFLEAVDHTISFEHQTDDDHRRVKTCIVTFAGDFKQLRLYTEIADHLEAATDAMMRAALSLRDFILIELLTR